MKEEREPAPGSETLKTNTSGGSGQAGSKRLVVEASAWSYISGSIPLAVALVYVVTLVVAFPPFTQAWTVFVFLTPFIKWAFAEPRWRKFLMTGYLAGWAAWFFILIWLRHIYPVWGWVGLALLSGILAFFLVAWLAALRWAAPRLRRASRGRRVLGLFGLAGWWIVLDWVRVWLFTGFPWLPLAAAFWRFPLLLQLAEWTGQWGVTFLIVLVNLGLVCGTGRELGAADAPLTTRGKIWWPGRFGVEISLPLLLLAGTLLLNLRLLDGDRRPVWTIRAGLVQPWTVVKWTPEPGIEERDWENLRDMTETFRDRRIDVVLWPEAAPPFAVAGPGTADATAAVQQLVDDVGRPLLFGALAVAPPAPGSATPAGVYDSIFLMQPGSGLEPESYAKRHLVPFGEYVPLRRWLPFLGKVVPLDADTLFGDHAQTIPLPLRDGRVLQAGPLVCYEDVFSSLARDQVRAGADLLVVLTNDSWYGTGGGALQHAAHSVLRAIETRRPVLRCGNDGWSGVIDAAGYAYPLLKNGAVIESGWALVSPGTTYFRGTGFASVYGDPLFAGRETFYVRFGDWFVTLSALLALAGLAAVRKTGAA